MESGKRSADLEQRDAKIRKLTEEFEENDTEHGECDAKLKERDRKITKLAAEIRRLTALLGERDVRLRKLTGELAKRDSTIRIFTLELGQQNTKIGELTADVSECNRKLRRHAAELAERDEKIWENEAEIRCLTELLGDRDLEIRKLREELAELKCREARKEEEKIADVTLDAGTAHPRLLLSRDLRSVRWEFGPDAPPDGPERFDADPCVLGHQSFTSGHHSWTVDLTRGQFCAVGVTKESRPRKGPGAFTPERGVWAVQRWGFKTRALTDPPVLLDLPRVPKKIRICLSYERGEVAFFDAENRAPIFRFPPAAFAGERLRPWFWVEFGSVSLVRP